MKARRTCPNCNVVRRYVAYRVCQECAVKEQQECMELQSRTYWRCCRVSVTPGPQGRDGRCEPCWLQWVIQRQFEGERFAVWSRACPGRYCQKVTATDAEVSAERAARPWRGPRWCPPCAERDERERAEQLRADQEARGHAREARRDEVASLIEWARAVLTDPDTVVLDAVIRGEACLTSGSVSANARGRITRSGTVSPTRRAVFRK